MIILLWESVLDTTKTKLDEDWQKQMGASTTKEYLIENNKILVAPGTTYVKPLENSDITTIRNQCKSLIIEHSWKMIFSKDENEFNSNLKLMQDKVKGLGYDKVLETDLQNANEQNSERIAAANN
jgi:multiple sugar transport system substrate-binding protein/putative aldouronate transport system substrate-binding protein